MGKIKNASPETQHPQTKETPATNVAEEGKSGAGAAQGAAGCSGSEGWNMSDEETLAKAIHDEWRKWAKQNTEGSPRPFRESKTKAGLIYVAKLLLDGHFDDLLKRKG